MFEISANNADLENIGHTNVARTRYAFFYISVSSVLGTHNLTDLIYNFNCPISPNGLSIDSLAHAHSNK